MAEKKLRAPGFQANEIDLTIPKAEEPTGVPHAIIGPSQKGPAFVPSLIGNFPSFEARFGGHNGEFITSYAVEQVVGNGKPVLFIRTLGAGTNKTVTDIELTRVTDTVRHAGMKVTGSAIADLRHNGSVQFLAAKHVVTSSEAVSYPMFSDNQSYTMTSNYVHLIRGVVFTASDTRLMVMSASEETFGNLLDDSVTIDDTSTNPTYRKFKLVISSSAGAAFATTDGLSGLRILTASFNPSSNDYFGKILNKDPEKFSTEKHLLYCDFPVDNEVATIASGSGNTETVVVLSGSSVTSPNSGLTSLSFRDAFGYYNTRYTTPKTPMFISQPFGETEHDLFYVEAIDDGAVATTKYKISISNIKRSIDPKYAYGTFTLLVRDFNDSDFEPKILERFSELSLDPDSVSFIGNVIGDRKIYFNFDVENEDDRRLVVNGKYPNNSKFIRVVISQNVINKQIPESCLPFGFKGVPVLNTNTLQTDSTPRLALARLAGSGSFNSRLTGSIIPPLPMRFKTTRGEVNSSPSFTGHNGPSEIVDSRLFWGVKFERNNNLSNPNLSSEKNEIINSYAKFQGLSKLDVLVTGSYADSFNDNKFTLAKVALSFTTIDNFTASVDTHMKEAAYIRNGKLLSPFYAITDGSWGNRLTLMSLLELSYYLPAQLSTFNRFSEHMKFSTFMYGGWDGTNIFDKAANRFNDRSTSTESSSVGYGGASTSYSSPGATTGVNHAGYGLENNQVNSYLQAVNLATDPNLSIANIVCAPGIREPLITDYLLDRCYSEHQMSEGVIDVPYYDDQNIRIFDGETRRTIDIENTAKNFDSRTIDKNVGVTYFPNITIEDGTNKKLLTVPASIAALSAISYTDKVSFPWWAVAGLNRASLDFVKGAQVRINNKTDREILYSARINPIIKLPRESFVIWSQQTLALGDSLFTNLNIKRMVLEIKRIIVAIATRLVFENITPDLYQNFTTQTNSVLSVVQTREGIESFKVICDETNNSDDDRNNNKMNGVIMVQPTKAFEYIELSFAVYPSGVVFSD